MKRKNSPLKLFTAAAGIVVIAITGFALPAHAGDAAAPRTQATWVKQELLPAASEWSYWSSTTAPTPRWRTGNVDWPTGTAPFARGIGIGHVNTVLTPFSGSAPLATFFRTDVTLTRDLPESAKITTWADDGIVAYVNGREVGRSNIAPGAITPTTYATRAPQTANAKQNQVTFTVPKRFWKPGTNVVSFQVASNWRATHNISFDASITRLDRVVVAPEDPVPTPAPAPSTPAPTPAPEPSVEPEPAPQPSVPAPAPKPSAPAPAPTPDPAPPTTTLPDANVPGWGEPTWRDEFSYVDPATNRAAVDPEKWNVRGRDDLGLLFDAAVVDRNQVTVENGVLHIRADWLDTPVVRPSSQTGPRDLWHKTGYLDQRHLRSGDVSIGQQYGRWEIRAKTPTGPQTYGSLAAFWLRNSQSGEIDIMEAWGYDERAVRDQPIDTAATTVHTHTSTPSANSKYIWTHSKLGGPSKVWQDFHTYAFEYTPSYAAIIVDGVELARATPTSHPNLWDQRYFGTPLHMRLNLHVGPSAQYWGLPDPARKQATQDLDFQIDYVRMWSYEGK